MNAPTRIPAGMKIPEHWLPHGSEHERVIKVAEFRISQRGIPHALLRLEPDGVAGMGPFDYYRVCKKFGLLRDEPRSMPSQGPLYEWLCEVWALGPKDVTWVVGKIARFKVWHELWHNEQMLQTFRLVEILNTEEAGANG